MAKLTQIIEEIKNGNKPETVTLVTHKSVPCFHADEVSATTLLRLLFDDKLCVPTEIIHTFKPAEEGYTDETPNCIVYDIGLGLYDHHQPDGQNQHCLREDKDGITRKYSSVGLIWKEIGKEFVPEEYVDEVYDNLIKFIDDQDNGFGTNPLSYVISHMNRHPSRKEETLGNDVPYFSQFEIACSIMRALFCNLFDYINAKKKEEEKVQVLISEAKKNGKKYVVSEEFITSMTTALAKEEIPFYIYPNARDNGYVFRTITPVDGEMNDHIVDIPQDVRNWYGVTFLHPSAFMGSAISKERAIEIVETILASNA